MKYLIRAVTAALLTIGLVLGTGVIAAAAVPFAGLAVAAGVDGAGEITIPVAPLGVTAIVSVLATYAISFLNGVLPFIVEAWQKKVVSVVVAVLLAGVGLVGYYLLSGDPWPSDAAGWFGFALVALGVSQTAYSLVTKDLGARQAEVAGERLTT